MSLALVAYGSSDESDNSDTEDINEKPIVSVTSSQEGPVKNGSDGLIHVDSDISSLDGKLRELPEPIRQNVASVIEETDELEDEVKPKASQLADAPKPPPKKTRKPVQITIPALPDNNEKEEASDKQPAKKKQKIGPATGKSGLTSLLPAPVHAPRKESNRILLPYTLTKKVNPNPTTPTVKKTNPTMDSAFKAKSLTTSLADYGSDSDENDDNNDEPVNFFSLGPSPKSEVKSSLVSSKPVNSDTQLKSVKQTVSLPPSLSRTSLSLPAPVTDNKNVSQSKSEGLITSAIMSESSPNSEGRSVKGRTATDPDAPLSFKAGTSRSYPTHEMSHNASSDQHMMYSMEFAGSHSYPEANDEQALKQDDQFLRLQGKKNRGKEEIHIVDVNADDFTSPSDITKYLTEEQPRQSHRKKDSNMPSHQQKRKHQIQYLAFEAKEREIELKNQWSNNKMSKKQTQAKYGF